MAYSIDFRKRAIEFIEEGHTEAELYEAFRIYPSNVNRWRKLLSKTNSLQPQYAKTRKRKIDKQKLVEVLERKPDLTLSELGAMFGCTKQSIDTALKTLKITRKKRHSLTQSSADLP
jgi:transposase